MSVWELQYSHGSSSFYLKKKLLIWKLVLKGENTLIANKLSSFGIVIAEGVNELNEGHFKLRDFIMK